MGEFPPEDTQEDELRKNSINTPALEQNIGLGARTYGDPTRANGEPMLAEKLAAVDAQKKTAENTGKTAEDTKDIVKEEEEQGKELARIRAKIEETGD